MTDYIAQLQYAGITSRLKRLSDRLQLSGRDLYKEIGSEIEPNWFLIFNVVLENGVSSISEITQKLKFSHPSVIAIVKKMQAKGYLDIVPSQTDKRRQEIRLSAKAKRELPDMRNMWSACEKAMQAMFIDDAFMAEFARVEEAFEQRSFKDRILKQLDNMDITIVDFEPKYAQAFGDMNKEWINHYFKIEPIDLQVLDNPYDYIIHKGGDIIMALDEDEVIGTVGLVKISEYVVELAKMAVRAEAHGKGIGALLMKKALIRAKEMGFKEVVLYSNRILKPALHLYEKFGFKEVELEPDVVYMRSNIKMSITLPM